MCVDVPSQNNDYMRSIGCGIPTVAILVLEMAVAEPEAFASMLQSSKLGSRQIYWWISNAPSLLYSSLLPCQLSLPMAWGIHVLMGVCPKLQKDVGKHIGTYSVCVPTGDNWLSDTINGFLLQYGQVG